MACFALIKTHIKVIEVQFPMVDTPWYQGKTPKIAISPKAAIDEMLIGLGKNKHMLKIGKVKLLYWLARLSPSLAFYLMNWLSKKL